MANGIIDLGSQADRSAQNIIKIIDSMAKIKQENVNIEKNLMLNEIQDEMKSRRALQSKRAEKEMDLEFEGKKAKNWWESMSENTQQREMQAPMPWDKNAPVPTVENNLPAMSMVGGGVGNIDAQQEQPVVIDGIEYPHPIQLYKSNDNKMEEWMRPYSMAYIKISQGKGTEREFNMIRNFGKELKSQPFTSLQEINLENIPKPTNEDERQQILASLPDDVAENVQAAGEYRLDAKAIYGLRNNSADRAKFDAIINRVYPGWNMAKYTQRQKYLGDLATGKLNQQVVSLNTLAKHLDSLDQTVESLKNTDLKPKNAIVNMAKDLTGDSTITDYRFAREVVYGELERALTGVGVTQEAMKRLDSLMSENAGFNQLKENISLLKTIVKGRITPLRTQYKNIMGEEESGQILFPESTEVFNSNDKEGMTSLPSEIKTTSEAVKYLTEQGMSEDEAIQWLRSQ